MPKFLIAALLLGLFAATAEAQQRCPKCGRYHAVAAQANSDQARAQAEADYMARNNIKGHVGGVIGRFEGCGWSSHGRPSTCTPHRRMRLTADATSRSRYGSFRVRAWR